MKYQFASIKVILAFQSHRVHLLNFHHNFVQSRRGSETKRKKSEFEAHHLILVPFLRTSEWLLRWKRAREQLLPTLWRRALTLAIRKTTSPHKPRLWEISNFPYSWGTKLTVPRCHFLAHKKRRLLANLLPSQFILTLFLLHPKSKEFKTLYIRDRFRS